MHVEMRRIDSIQPYANNPRHNDAGVDAVAASSRAYGFRQPLVVDEDGVILVGHTRYKAALKLGLQEVPVHIAIGLNPAQAKAYRLADNQTATLSFWDDDKLSVELAHLQQLDFDLNLTGFSADELVQLLGSEENAGLTDPDAVPEPPDEPITQPGDLWLLGKHRLLCGDSSTTEDVDRLLDGAAIHLVHTDPPYNVRLEPRSNNAIAAGLSSFPAEARPHYHGFDLARHAQKGKPTTKKLRAKDRPLKNDFVSDEEFERLLHARLAETASDDDIAAWCCGGGVGSLPPPGPQPVKYTPGQWQARHRLLLILCCRAPGGVDPPEVTPPQRQEADETLALFAAIDPSGRLSLPQQARLASYREVIARFLNPEGGGGALPASARGQPA